jgi:undecaprenyl-diphosphatase
MSYLHALILGIVEGLTEFLPVSSTAHLILAGHALGDADDAFQKSFEIIIQLGAILAVVAIYWRRLLDVRLLRTLVIAFIPTGVIGLTVYKALKTYLLGNLAVVLTSLLVGGVVLILFDRGPRDPDEMPRLENITMRQALLVGLFQAIAIVPGVSRSAATIVGGTLIGIPRRTIIEFSFLLAVPTMAAASGYDLLKSHGALSGHFDVLAVGFVVSFLVALVAIRSFLAFIRRRSFAAFGWYRVALALVYYAVFLR